MLIAGNWKMNTEAGSAVELAAGVVDAVSLHAAVRVAVCPPFVSLGIVKDVLDRADTHVSLGAQNLFFEESGAFTGEISAAMLKSVGCLYAIIGHSERRQYFGETDESVNKKTAQAMQHGLIPIVCVGETLEERDAGREQEVVRAQVLNALQAIAVSSADDIVIAYEPVWAIGTGRTATPGRLRKSMRS